MAMFAVSEMADDSLDQKGVRRNLSRRYARAAKHYGPAAKRYGLAAKRYDDPP
jgi:hypothetical protein